MKEILITSSVLIAVIMLLRWLLRGKVSQRLIYAAWALVALRLLIPIQIGQLDFSLLTAARPVTQAVEQVTDRQVAGVTDQDAYRQVLQEYIDKDPSVFTPVVQGHIQSCVEIEMSGEEIAEMIDKVYTQQEVFIPQVQPQVQQQVEATAAPVTVGQILTGIWMTGMAVMAVWFLIANLIFLRRAKKDSVEAEFGGVRVRISPNVSTPCVVGLLRPVIYLTPASAGNEQGRRHVLAHEQAHLHHGDHIWALVRCLCLCIYWFNPLVWIAAAQCRRDCELACDESALKKLGDGERMAYGKTLLDIVSQSVSPSHLIHTATAMNESKKQLTERVKYIVKKPRNILIAAVCLILVASIVTGCAFLGGNPGTSADPTDPPAQPTDPISPGVPDSPSPGDDVDLPDGDTMERIQELVKGYTWYMAVGTCCDFELDSRDLSGWLTDSQKQTYTGQQYRITCCHTAQEFQAHIDRTLAKDLQIREDIADRLFTDGDGQLYLIVIPTGYVDYRNVTAVESDGVLCAKAGAYDEDGWFADAYFVINCSKENLIITQAYQGYDAPSWVQNLTFPTYGGDGGDAQKHKFDYPAEYLDETIYPLPDGFGLDQLVMTAVDRDYVGVDGHILSIRIPWILPISSGVAQTNRSLAEAVRAIVEESPGAYSAVDYDAWLNGNLLSVLLRFTDAAGKDTYTAYNLDVSTGEYLSNQQMVRRYLDISWPQFLMATNDAVCHRIYDMASGFAGQDEVRPITEEVYSDTVAMFVRQLYLGEGGQPMLIYVGSWWRSEFGLNSKAVCAFDPSAINSEKAAFDWFFGLREKTDGITATGYDVLLREVFFYDPQAFVAHLSCQDSSCVDKVSGDILQELSNEQLSAYQATLEELYGESTEPAWRNTVNRLMEKASA